MRDVRVTAQEEVAPRRAAPHDGVADAELGNVLEHSVDGAHRLLIGERVRVGGVVLANAVRCRHCDLGRPPSVLPLLVEGLGLPCLLVVEEAK